MWYKLVQCLKTLLGSSFLHKTDYQITVLKYGKMRRNRDLPVNTIRTATVILTASSIFPMIALTEALPHKSKISGLS
jgi:hypothetical protein